MIEARRQAQEDSRTKKIQFMNKKDYDTLKNVLEFNQFDLYSKEDDIHISNDVKIYYDNLLNEFFSGELQW